MTTLLVQTDVFHVYGVGVGQSLIIEIGLVVATVGVAGYRTFTRRKRYHRG